MTPTPHPPREDDPVLRNARREALWIISAWAAATAYCCLYCYRYGYIREGRPLGVEDIQPIWGVPSWFFWGVLAPWLACGLFTAWFVGTKMVEDDLGEDHAGDLESAIRGGGDDE